MATDVQPQAASIEPSRIPTPIRKNSRQTKKSGWVRWLILLVCIAAIGILIALFADGFSTKEAGPKLTHTIGRRDIEVAVTEQGTLESSNNTEVRCKVKGPSSTIVWIIKNGSVVKPGDLLVKIDTSTIETNINTQEIAYQNALATYAQSKSDVEVAEINITEYLEGTFRSELKTKEKDVAIAEANLRSAKNMLNHAKEMYRRGFMSKLELEGNKYSLDQAVLELEVKETDVDVLTRYTKAKQTKDLNGILAAKKAKLASDEASLKLEKSKLEREKKQLENCIVKSKTSGMVIYKEHEEWEDRPDIREGATVREDQVLLLIPDLENMQVKVGIHEARVDQIKPGLRAEVTLQEQSYHGAVHLVAPMAERAGWWNGNTVKYATTVKLDSKSGLKPGMSATTKVFISEHKDVVAIPVAAVVEKGNEFFCWVKIGNETERRALQLSASNDQFLVVESGVDEGDEVVINPIAYIEKARNEALQPYSGDRSSASRTAKNKKATSSEAPKDGDASKSKEADSKEAKVGEAESEVAKSDGTENEVSKTDETSTNVDAEATNNLPGKDETGSETSSDETSSDETSEHESGEDEK